MNCKLVFSILFIIVSTQITFAQSKKSLSNEKRVKDTIIKFNQILFEEMDSPKAIEAYFFTETADSTDLKFGLENDFQDITKNISKEDKIKCFSTEFYFRFAIPLIQWRLGTISVTANTNFIDGELAEDKDLKKNWDKELAELGITESELDKIGNPNKSNIDFYEKFSQKLMVAIAQNTNRQLLVKNLNFINEHMEIKKEVFGDREYFTIENKLFNYTIAIKNGAPKIMHINRS